ncbi:MAG: hypothetical protein RR910_08230, partial [Acidaminococcaceae bacterium]
VIETSERKAVTTDKNPERFIYLGPNLLSAGLQTNQVFKGGKPAVLEGLKGQYPMIDQLFAPVAELHILQKLIATKGTAANLAYKEMSEREMKN